MKRIRAHHRLMLSLTKSLLKSFTRPVFLYLTTLSMSIMLLSSFGIYWFESAANPNVNSWFDALYLSVTITTGVGLGDIAPVSSGGRLLSMGMMLMGTAIFVAFTACLATALFEMEISAKEEEQS